MTLNTTWPIQESKSDFFMTARVLLVADHSVMQEGLRVLLGREDDIKVVGVAGDGRTAVEMAPDHFERQKAAFRKANIRHSPTDWLPAGCYLLGRKVSQIIQGRSAGGFRPAHPGFMAGLTRAPATHLGK